jgi:hypothetical protein
MKKAMILFAALLFCANLVIAQPIPMQDKFMLGLWGPGENSNYPYTGYVARHYNHLETELDTTNLNLAGSAGIKISGCDPSTAAWTPYGSNPYWAVQYLSFKTTVDIDYAATNGYLPPQGHMTYQPFANESCIGVDLYDTPPVVGGAYRNVTSDLGSGLMIDGLNTGYSRPFWTYQKTINESGYKLFYMRLHARPGCPTALRWVGII